ncbi:MAG: peptidylprolyl isomerase [Rhodoferax sp.]|nr:peptidylprolyl isomerase [Rhodoferax sp.]
MLPFNSRRVGAGWGVQWSCCLLVVAVLLCSGCGEGGSGTTADGANSNSNSNSIASATTQKGIGIDSITFDAALPQQGGLLPVNIAVPSDTWQTDYCFKPGDTAPAAPDPKTDSCFIKASKLKFISPATYAGNGKYVYVWARDVFGRISSQPYQVSIPADQDTVIPVISNAMYASTSTTQQILVTPTATDNYWVASYCVKGGDNKDTAPAAPDAKDSCFANYGSSFNFNTKSMQGQNFPWLWALDAAGNVSQGKLMTQDPSNLVDSKKPSVQIASIQPGSTTGHFTVKVTASDDLWVSAYCIKDAAGAANPTPPAADDPCFGNNPEIDYVVPANGTEIPYQTALWVRDSAANVGGTAVKDPVSSDASGYLLSSSCSAEGMQVANNQTEFRDVVCMGTSLGELVIGLYSANLKPGQTAPTATINNFLTYVRDGFYSNTVFHRIISNFMVQTGGFTYDGSKYAAKSDGLKVNIPLEGTATTKLSNSQYTVTMARSNDTNSANSQFFINLMDNNECNKASSICGSTNLDASPADAETGASASDGYAVFGKVIKGIDDTLFRLKIVPVITSSLVPGDDAASMPSPTPPVIFWAKQIKGNPPN